MGEAAAVGTSTSSARTRREAQRLNADEAIAPRLARQDKGKEQQKHCGRMFAFKPISACDPIRRIGFAGSSRLLKPVPGLAAGNPTVYLGSGPSRSTNGDGSRREVSYFGLMDLSKQGPPSRGQNGHFISVAPGSE